MKKLLTILLIECIKRDFKTTTSTGEVMFTGMCAIVSDLEEEGIITFDELRILKSYIFLNKPADANDAHWYDSTPNGNFKRIEWMIKSVNNEND